MIRFLAPYLSLPYSFNWFSVESSVYWWILTVLLSDSLHVCSPVGLSLSSSALHDWARASFWPERKHFGPSFLYILFAVHFCFEIIYQVKDLPFSPPFAACVLFFIIFFIAYWQVIAAILGYKVIQFFFLLRQGLIV